jgi:hypothetical protein
VGIRRESLNALLVNAGADKSKLADAATAAERAGINLLGGIARTQAVDDGLLAQTLGEMTGLTVIKDVAVDCVRLAAIVGVR